VDFITMDAADRSLVKRDASSVALFARNAKALRSLPTESSHASHGPAMPRRLRNTLHPGEIFAVNVTLEVKGMAEREGQTIVTVKRVDLSSSSFGAFSACVSHPMK
jgi:hypothetical protein